MVNKISENIKNALFKTAALVENRMEEILPKAINFSDSKLVLAMNYSASGKGKRIRPFLTLSAANIFKANSKSALDVAAALEFIHIYSLIHDDLPAMDDDDLRRGVPSCHKKFDEATAILAGDSLLTFAFEILSSPSLELSAEIKCQLIHHISKSIGFEGMAGGQMLDLEAQNKKLTKEEIFKLHHLKTGKLFIAAIEAGAILGGAEQEKRDALVNYGKTIGLAFQIKDDLLDFIEEKTNPRTKPDAASIVALIGEDAALEKLNLLEKQANCDLDIFGKEADLLRELAQFIVKREA